ncbi:MAG TPA: hypothetical protein VFZ11_10685, partial [Gemmatimonadaceae bacterium]
MELGLPEPLRRPERSGRPSHGPEEHSLTAGPRPSALGTGRGESPALQDKHGEAGRTDRPAERQAPSAERQLHWDSLPLALEAGSRLRAVSAGAGRRGVRAGMALPEARARCAELVVLPWDDAAVARAITETTVALLAASPQVTPVAGAPGTWWIGASGFDALGGERTLARDLLAIASRWHPGARVAIADSCVAARAGTWMNADAERFPHAASRIPQDSAGRIVVVRPHGDAAFLAPVPLALVPMDDEMRQALVALGLGTLGALAALDPADVERRWGADGLRSWRLARGDDRRRPVLARPERARFVEAELPVPAATTEPVLFLVRAALDRLVAELAAEGRAAAAVSVTLTLDLPRGALPDGTRAHTVTREVRPARALARAAPLFEQCRALLERWTPGAPICGVAVALTATAPASAEQGDLLDTSWRDAAAADAAFARLRAALGPGVVVRPVQRDEHRPEKAGTWDEADGDEAGVATEDGGRGTG